MFRHVSLIVLSTAVYGLALGWWRSIEMALYVAAKLPVVFVGTTLVVSAFAWMAGLVVGAGLRYREVLGLVFAAMASASRLLLALVPVVIFFVLSAAPTDGTKEELRFAHAALLVTHIAVFAAAGVLGNLTLVRELRERVSAKCHVSVLVALWLGVFALVGCQVGWMMRPLVGSPNITAEFLREDALDSNFLESVFTQVIPHLIHKGEIRP